MSNLREELKRQFSSQGLVNQDDKTDVNNPKEKIIETKSPQVKIEEIEVLMAPKSYSEEFAADFKNLPPNWQKFLSERENNVSRKMDDDARHLQTFRGIETIFNSRKDNLQNKGIKSLQEWIEGLAWIDENMDRRPAEVIKSLATLYGVDFNSPQYKNEPISVEAIARLHRLERNMHNFISYFHNLRLQQLKEMMDVFATQKDAEGKLLHPYFKEVFPQFMQILRGNGLSDMNKAYEQAVWINPKVRKELIDKKISSEAQEAKIAQKASFSPKGKAQAPERRLTLREQLEKNWAAIKDKD